MDGRLFLTTASFLQSNCSGEAAYRTDVSRAYYVCFLEARHSLFENSDSKERLRAGISTLRQIQHDKLSIFLKNSVEPEIK